MKVFLKFHQLGYKTVLNDFHPNPFLPHNHDQEQNQTLVRSESVVPQQSHPAVVGHLVFRNLSIIISLNQAGFGGTKGAFSNWACGSHMSKAATVHASAFSHAEGTFFR